MFRVLPPGLRLAYFGFIAYAGVAFVLSVCSSFEQLAVLSNVAVLLMYLLCFAGVWPLLRRQTHSERVFTFPGMQVMPALAIGAVLYLFWLTKPWDKFVKIAAILVVFSVLYFFRTLFRRKA